MKHSPKPWSITNNGIIMSKDGSPVATMFIQRKQEGIHHSLDVDTEKANSTLMVSSPDMFDMLKKIADAIAYGGDVNEMTEEIEGVIERAEP